MPRLGTEWWIAKLVMLTNIDLVIQAYYSFLLLLSHCGNPKLKRFKDFTFFTTAFPCGMATCLLFWILYLFDPESIMPKWIRDLIPFWMNHVTHTFPLIALTVDLFFAKHVAVNFSRGSLMVLLLFWVYFLLVVYIRFSWGYWLYPIFDMIGPLPSIIFILAAGFIFWGLFYIGYKAHYLTKNSWNHLKLQ
uniref:FAR-17a/AIG1-like protein n=2 Tax=Bursaphelenchus xylophilus TaxID=6326 RepID=A0A1I7SFA3_BURXY